MGAGKNLRMLEQILEKWNESKKASKKKREIIRNFTGSRKWYFLSNIQFVIR